MAFKVPYELRRDHDGSFLPTVHLQIILANPETSKRVPARAVVDSGATRTVFDSRLAKMIGVDLHAGELRYAEGVGGIVEMWLHDVELQLPGGPIRVRAGFQENLPVPGLLGMNGFFEYFRITFDGAARYCEFDRLAR